MNALQLFGRFLVISLKKEYAYRFELFMTLLQMLFNVSFTLIFWYTMFQYVPALEGWCMEELLFYTAIVLLGEGMSGIFFGFRDMPMQIMGGEPDKYLVRPMSTLVSLMSENISVFYLLEQAIVSFIMVGIIGFKYQLSINLANLLPAVLILIIGVTAIQLMIGIFTFSSFWLGRIENIRNLFMGILIIKEYPMNIFPKKLQRGLTYLIPVYFVAYYPCTLLLGKETFDFRMLGYAFLYLIVLFFIFAEMWKLGLKKYEANGG